MARPEITDDSSPEDSSPKEGQIDDTNVLISDIGDLYQSGSYSDVVLEVQGERLRAHRSILASRSNFFRILFYGGGSKTSDSDVPIKDVSLTLFQRIFKYIYTGRIDLRDFKNEEIFELHKLSDYFGISHLKLSLKKYLQRTINQYNACTFITLARIYKNEELEVEFLKFIDDNAEEVLDSNDFRTLSSEVLQEILNRDSFYANELVIFREVCRWVNENQNKLNRDTKIEVLSAVRYPIMSVGEQSQARESQLVRSDIISAAMQLRRNTWPQDKPQLRGRLILDDRIRYESHSSPLPDLNTIHQSRGFAVRYMEIGTNMIRLTKPSFVNFINITLWDPVESKKPFSYYIEVSNDGQNWKRVIDHSNDNCQGDQELWIHPQIVRYIHIAGTNRSANALFRIWRLLYKTKD
ncbi:BTB/POZ domain-containing protein 9-like isoform X2 [Adelges cooleyi]|nr:BTB/POZ domain-containing protein 9-like isoform X2 [Adelges cooleyi]